VQDCIVPSPAIFWFRRDLRLTDNPALVAACAVGPVVGVFIHDQALRGPSGPNRLAFLSKTLLWLDGQIGGHLVTRSGDPLEVLAQLAKEVGASNVFAADDYGPYGRRRDTRVGEGLARLGIATNYVQSSYAVAPGSIFTGGRTPYNVFTPFFHSWKQHSWPLPVAKPETDWVAGVPGESPPLSPQVTCTLPPVGEAAAMQRAEMFLERRVLEYPEARNNPGIDGTSGLSPYLKWGNIHPRQILAMLGVHPAEDVFRSEIAWREFYADVLFHRPETARTAFVPKMERIRVDTGPEAIELFDRWRSGLTGFPIVDAGMRQLVSDGWMHNRVRMIVASFLVKDLHLPWQWGARFFMKHLLDADLASNNHGWQWCAGSGTDASPYFRVFNPTSQSKKFDPDGMYLRRWLPELAHLSSKEIHEPAASSAGLPDQYPAPMVNHSLERIDALARLAALKKG
jgi:deoxyribodipyrimidine photo-lyase